MVWHDNMCAMADDELCQSLAPVLKVIEFCKERFRVDHYPVSDHTDFAGVEDAGRE
ncbi:hypothetical protein SDC9_192920 [bioreactor metagenome]|uniref:Uncharacterized protein n=1 Tax=bioreactor metagenome TaxID=1076179 RepID=A0A645ID49_9ZZZZ